MTAATLRQPFPLPSSPLVDPQTGVLTDQWFNLLAALYRRTGSSSGVNSATVQATAGAAMPDTLAALTALLLSAPTSLPSAAGVLWLNNGVPSIS